MKRGRVAVALAVVTLAVGATSQAEAANLVINGNFSNGNAGFSSAYGVASGAMMSCYPEGVYAVVTSPSACHPFWTNFGDHTTGSGYLMTVNGAGTPGTIAWQESLGVVQNTQYYFSAWVSSAHPTSPALLQFSINGSTIGTVFAAPATPGQWQQFYAPWFSSNNSTALISIVNQNTVPVGNDFTLDDISLDVGVPEGINTVPEPASLTLLGSALVGWAAKRARRRKA